MLAKMLKAGDEYRDQDDVVQVTVIFDAQPDGTSPISGKPQVVTGMRYRDGSTLRWFDADDEVPYTRPEKKD